MLYYNHQFNHLLAQIFKPSNYATNSYLCKPGFSYLYLPFLEYKNVEVSKINVLNKLVLHYMKILFAYI